jgi:ribosome-associated heat shock protein Hsp15
MPEKIPLQALRLDKWLWAARLFKTRALAAEAAQLGRVQVNGLAAKPGRELRAGDRLALREGGLTREFMVLGLSGQRGPAPVAQTLYAETPASVAARAAAATRRAQGVEPADTFVQGRPTRRDRRQLADWQRWSAQADDTR